MAAGVAGDLAAAGGVPGQDRVTQVESLDEAGQVIGMVIHVVAVPRLGRPAVAAPVMGDGPVPV